MVELHREGSAPAACAAGLFCMNSGFTEDQPALSKANRPAALKHSDPRAFLATESDRGPGHTPGHGPAVLWPGSCPLDIIQVTTLMDIKDKV